MLERIREGLHGPWAIVIVALIVVSFVFTGVGSYLNSDTSVAAAVVNDEEITQQSLEIAVNNERARMEAQFGEGISALFESEQYFSEFRQGVLDRLINESLIGQKANELGLRVSDEQVRDAILAFPQFQIAGQFNNDTYRMAIQRAGYTPDSFAEYIRVQLTREQLSQAVLGSSFKAEKSIQQLLSLQQQTRDAKYVEVPSDRYLDEVEITDEQVQAFYEQNIEQYDTQERVKLAYVELSVDDLMRDVAVTEADIQQYYQDNLAFYQTPEVRQVAHILFETTDDAEAAKAEAEQVLAELTNGADFAVMAGTYSDDPVSAEEGGNLGEIERGDFDPAFSDAAFALQKVGDISPVIESEFGLHIIKLTALSEVETTPLAEVTDEISEAIKRDVATDEFFALQSEIERVAFEAIDSLDDVADIARQPVQQTGLFSRNAFPAEVNFPQVENVAFSDELIIDQVNSEVLTIENDRIMVVRVIEHEPTRTRTLEEMTPQITQQLQLDGAQQKAYSWAQTVQQQLLDGIDVGPMFEQKALKWQEFSALTRNNADMPRAVTSALFALSGVSSNQSQVVSLTNGNIGLVVLESVNPPQDLTDNDIAAAAPNLANQYAQRTFENFIAALREEAEIKVVRR